MYERVMFLDTMIVSAAGGILCLDRILLQAMISRPIVAAPVIGLILGDPYTGLVTGAFIELFWIDRLPIGAYVTPNDTMAAILITASAIGSGRILGALPEGLIALAVLIFVPLGIVAQKMDMWIVKGNERPAREALSDAARGAFRAIARKHLAAILKTYLLPVVFILIALPIGTGLLIWIYPRLAPWTVRGLTLVYAALPLIGAAVALNTIHLRGTIPIFCAIFLTATVSLGFIRGN